MSVNVCHREEVLRFSTDSDDVTFRFIKNQILDKYPLLDWNEIQLCWKDSDGNDVPIEDDNGVKEYKQICPNNVLRVFIKDVKPENSTKSEIKAAKIGSFAESKIFSCKTVKSNDLKNSKKGLQHVIEKLVSKCTNETAESTTNTPKFVRRNIAGGKNADSAKTKNSNSSSQSSSVVKNSSPRRRKSLKNTRHKISAFQNADSAEDDFRMQESIVGKKSPRVIKKAKCKLCNAIVKQTTVAVLNHLQVVHLKNTAGIDWLYKCVACDKRYLSLFCMQQHLAHSCSKNAGLGGRKNVGYLENEQVIGELEKIRLQAFPLFPSRSQKRGNCPVKCSVCDKEVLHYYRKYHAVIHVEEATGNTWLYKCSSCEKFTSVCIASMCKHVKRAHGNGFCRKGVEYSEVGSIKKIIKLAVSYAFPEKC